MSIYLGSKPISMYLGGIKQCDPVPPSPSVEIVSFSDGTDAEVQAMIRAAHQGLINLEDHWAVGDTRTIILNDKTYSGNAGNMTTNNEQVELVLVEKLSDSPSYGKENGFIIQTKNCLKTTMKFNSGSSNAGSFGGSNICEFLNDNTNGFLSMIPNWLSDVLLTGNIVTGVSSSTSPISIISRNKIFLPAVREVLGPNTIATTEGQETNFSILVEFNALNLWSYYTDSSKKLKQVNGSNKQWWLRSSQTNSSGIHYIDEDAIHSITASSFLYGIAPCMII